MINLVNQLLFTGGKNAINRFIEVILEEYDYCNDCLKLTKKFPYLKGYDSHLIVQKNR